MKKESRVVENSEHPLQRRDSLFQREKKLCYLAKMKQRLEHKWANEGKMDRGKEIAQPRFASVF